MRTALITGASSGIGKEFAKIHASRGGNLIIVARRENKLLELKQELEKDYGITVTTIQKDLTNEKASIEVFEEIKEKGIKVDYLINNAGFGGLGKFHERQWEKDLAMINLNIVALTELTRLFLPEFVSRNEGKILNVSSTASLMPGPLQAVYYATKAYVTSFSNAVDEELHDTNVSVTALLPGATESEFGSTSGMDKTGLFNKTASAYDVALDGYNGMLKGKLNVISGITTSQKIMFKLLPFLSTRTKLKTIRKMQSID
jgi:short-subunit dehydrogenase